MPLINARRTLRTNTKLLQVVTSIYCLVCANTFAYSFVPYGTYDLLDSLKTAVDFYASLVGVQVDFAGASPSSSNAIYYDF